MRDPSQGRGEARSQPGVCRGSVPGPMMGEGVVARRMWPSSVASLGRVTHAPADSTLYRAMMRGHLLHPSGAAPGFDGVGSIRHRSQNFLRRWWVGGGGRGGRNFLSGAGAGVAVGSATSSSFRSKMWRCPSSSSSTEWWTFPVVLQRRVPTVQTVQKTSRSYRCCSWTRLRRPLLYNDRCFGFASSENCGSSTVAVLGLCGSHPCRGAEADPHGPVCSEDHRDSAVAVH